MKDRNKRPLFQYMEGFGGVELIIKKMRCFYISL